MTNEISKTHSSTNAHAPDQKGRVLHASYSGYSGPLPPASEFAKYEEVHPGAADRILTMAEEQSQHRHAQEATIINSATRRSLLGTIFAFVIVIVGMLAGTYLVLQDKSTEGLVAILIPLATIVGLFIYREHQRSKTGE